MPDIEGGCKRDFRVISLVPDVCKSPMVPVPYPVVALLKDGVRTAAKVHFSGKGSSDTFTLNSRITTLSGDEAGAGGGVISGVNKGWSRPINGSATVRAQGFGVLQEKVSLFWMNCPGPEGPGNTVGMLLFDRRSTSAAVGPDGLSLAELEVVPETEAEAGFLDGMLGQLGLSTDDLGNVFEWGKQAYALSQVDWSNPAGVLGGIAGLAGIPGLGGIANAAGIAQMGYNLATMDWSDPAQVMGALGGVAGLAGLSDIARLTSLGGQALALATTDWTDPDRLVGAIGHASNLAGYGGMAEALETGRQASSIATTDWRNPGAIVGAAMNLAGMSGVGLMPTSPDLAPNSVPQQIPTAKTAPSGRPPGMIETAPFRPIGKSDPSYLTRLTPTPDDGPNVWCDPVLQEMSRRSWSRLPSRNDNDIAALRISEPGYLIGSADPTIVPETQAERTSTMRRNLMRSATADGRPLRPVEYPRLPIDENGVVPDSARSYDIADLEKVAGWTIAESDWRSSRG